MDLLAIIEHHGYTVTAHGGSLNLWLVIAIAFVAAMSGDTLMYLGGRYTGWWLLAGLCRLSTNAETCIFGAANSFYKRGPKTLVVAKFIPGLATVAAPLAGSLNMRPGRFLRLDAAGVFLYVSTWTLAGFVFARFLRNLVGWIERVGHVTTALVMMLLLFYGLWLMANWVRDTRFSNVKRVQVQELLEEMRTATHQKLVVIADVRSHGYYDPGMQRIKNSIRVEPSRLREELVALREFMQPECEIYLYCSCAHEATSVRVAKMLELENCSTKVIQGGLKAWVKAGGPTEPVPAGDVEHLPKFD